MGTETSMKEFILPTGAFCRARVLQGRDLVEALRLKDIAEKEGQTQNFAFILATLCVTVDEKAVTYEQLLNMDLRDVVKIHGIVSDYLSGPVR